MGGWNWIAPCGFRTTGASAATPCDLDAGLRCADMAGDEIKVKTMSVREISEAEWASIEAALDKSEQATTKMTIREAEIAKFRDQAALEELVAGTLDEFAFQCDADGENGEQPIEQRRGLIELAATAMRDAVFEDDGDLRGVVDAVMVRFRELCTEMVDGQ